MSAAQEQNPGWLERLRRRCSRVTSSGRHFYPEIDGLRFLAIAMVVLYHLHDHLTQRHPALIPWREEKGFAYQLFQQGHIGVQLFFVISGFILAMPFVKWRLSGGKPVSLKAYFTRRLTRLEPPYLVNLAIFFALLVVVRGDDWQALVGPLLASATYTNNVVYGEMSRINFVAWSLEVEAQFYLLAPLLSLLYCIRASFIRRATVISVGVLAFGIDHWLRHVYPNSVPTSILGSLIFFTLGWLIADLQITSIDNQTSSRHIWDVIGFLNVGVITVFADWLPTLITAPLLGFLVHSAIQGRWFRRLFSIPWIVTIGGMCYTIYLYHFLLITAIGRSTRSIEIPIGYLGNFTAQAILILIPTLVVCVVLFLFFERPFMSLATAGKVQERNTSADSFAVTSDSGT